MAEQAVRKHYRIHSDSVWCQIRRLYERGRAPSEICRAFGVSKSTLMTRRRRESWSQSRFLGRQLNDCSPDVSRTGASGHMPAMRSCGKADGTPALVLGPLEATRDRDVLVRVHGPSEDTVPRSAGEPTLELVDCLRCWVEELVAETGLESGTLLQRTRAMVDLASAIERLQKIERTALLGGANTSSPQTPVVIVVPAKLNEEDWCTATATSMASG